MRESAPAGIVCVNGVFSTPEEARVPAMDPGVLFGDGLFETLRAYGGRAFRLEAHLQRLRQSAEAADFPALPNELAPWTRQTLERSALSEAHVRITFTRGGTLIIAALPLKLPPPELYERGARALLMWSRDPDELPRPEWKTTSYQRSLLARRECSAAGAYEGLFLDAKGNVLEGAGSNLFVVKKGELLTPVRGCLHGITRAEIIRIGERSGLEVHETELSRETLLCAEEVFVTSSIAELVPIVEVGSRHEVAVTTIASGQPGPLTRDLHASYRRAIAEERG